MKPLVIVKGSMMRWNRGLWFKIAVLSDPFVDPITVIRVASKPSPSQDGRYVYHFNNYQLSELRE